MAYSTSTTFGVNNRVLTMGDPIHFATTARSFPATVLDCGDTGPTVIMYLDPTADPPAQTYEIGGGTVIQHDSAATGPDNLTAGKWMLRTAPPSAG